MLLATLASVLVLAALMTAIQQSSLANTRLIARLNASYQTALEARSADALSRGLIVDAMVAEERRNGRPQLDGTPFEIDVLGNPWVLAANDVEGLVDLYLAPAELLRVLPDAAGLAERRTRFMSGQDPAPRFPALAQTMAQFGLTADERGQLKGLVTQAGTQMRIRPQTAPLRLRRALDGLPPNLLSYGQTTHVVVVLTPKR